MKTNSSLRRLNIPQNDHISSTRAVLSAMLAEWRQKLACCSIFAACPAMLIAHATEAVANDAKETRSSVPGKSPRVLQWLSKSCSKPALLKRQSEYRLPHQKGSYDWLVALAGNDDCPGRPIPAGNYTAASPYTDSGDTTGANNTVNRARLYYYCYFFNDVPGSDHVYSFTLTGVNGANPQIQISRTSGSYEPVAYILDGRFGECPVSPVNPGFEPCNLIAFAESAQGGTATLNSSQMRNLPINVPLYLFVDSARHDVSGSGPYTIRIQDVTIAPTTCFNPNPIDCPDSFIRQHYLDFLNREPDAGGLAYWTNEITRCGSDAGCNNRRIDVSAAFFIEPEFQEAGYFVYRFYKASFNRQPNNAEFNADRSRISTGSNLEASKQTFAHEWVQRPAFVSAFPVTMSNTEFVNKLFEFAGLTATRYDPLRQQEILAMNSGRSRALVVRDVIEIPDFKNAPDPNDSLYSELKQISQYNPAFVLMQYFGYLRRDVDPSGYAFWLDVLNNREPNNYRGMVCAFLTSAEYQRRFGSVVTRSNADCGQ